MSDAVASRPGNDNIGTVAKGGMLNLIGLLTYGAANFALVAVVTLQLGAEGTGAFLISVGIFTIGQKIAELGAVTGLVRHISSFRATGRAGDVTSAVRVAIVPVAIAGATAATAVFLLADPFARLFSDGERVDEVADILRTIAPFLAIAPVYNVVIQATRGFESMLPQVALERVGRALFQPMAALVVTSGGGGPQAVGLTWAASFAVFLLPAVLVFRNQLARLEDTEHPPAPRSAVRVEFWRFTLPRSAGQLFEVGVQWADTLVVGAVVGTEAAGIYAAGSRFLLLAVYAVDALIQVVGPRLSGLLARDETDDASEILSTAAGWHMALVWPVYLAVFTYASVFLSVLGSEFVAAEAALRWLSAAALVAAVNGPSVSVILMGGRSSLALFNTAVAFAINVTGNILLVPTYGITGAGAVWAVTIVISSLLPAVESSVLLGVRPWQRPSLVVGRVALGTVGVAALCTRLFIGDTIAALAATIVVGGGAYAVLMVRRADELHLRELVGRRTAPSQAAP